MKQDLQVKAADVRAIDVGYYNTKYTLGRDKVSNAIRTAAFPSLAPVVPPLSMTSATGALAARIWHVAVNGVDYCVGPDAGTQASSSEPRTVDTQYSASDKYRALMLGAMNHMAEEDGAGADYTIRHLVLGLPQTTYQEHARRLQTEMVGRHEIKRSRGEVTRRVVVEEVKVVLQPMGAIVARSLGNASAIKGLNVVIDPGGGTLDWFVCSGAHANWARSGSHPKAMLHCAQAVADSIDKDWRNQFDIMETIDKALRRGDETFRVGMSDYNLAEYRPAVDAVLAEAVSVMKAKLGRIDNASQVIFAGGGAPLFYQYMVQRDDSLVKVMHVEQDPMYTNLFGFQLLGERTALPQGR